MTNYHITNCVNTVKLKETFKCTTLFFFNIALCLSVSPLSVWMSFFHCDSSLFIPKPPLLKTPSVKIKLFSHTINIHTRKLICWISFSLTAHSHLRWSLRPSLAASHHFCFISFSWLVTQIVTSGGDLWSPGVPLCWPYAGPRTLLNTEEWPSSHWTKAWTYHARPSWVQPSAQGAH